MLVVSPVICRLTIPMIRNFIAIALTVVVLLVLATISIPIAAGQDVGPLFPPRPASQTPVITIPSPSEPRLAAPIVAPDPVLPPANCAEEDHWLVSIRHCRQGCRNCGQCCSLDFFKDCCRQRVTQNDFTNSLQPGVPVCIVVHGSYVTADSVQEECQRTFRWLRQAAPHRPLHVVFFTWPSEGPLTFDRSNALTSPLPGVDVAILGRRAEFNGIRLAQLMNAIPSQNPICLIGHSHGARIVSSALHLVGGGSVQNLALRQVVPHRIRTVLAAAAIDHDWLLPNERYGRVLCTTECLVNLRSRKDWALWFYPLRKPFSPASLGRKGFSDRDMRKMGEHAAQISELDVTDYVGVGHIWPNYYERDEIANAIAPVVYFDE